MVTSLGSRPTELFTSHLQSGSFLWSLFTCAGEPCSSTATETEREEPHAETSDGSRFGGGY